MKKIALYLRLSHSDMDLGNDGKDESNSIENQRMLLQEFLKTRDNLIGEVVEYVDDGFTGTNFDRPAFKQMIEDAKSGVIDTIVVKDLSRLGRDYIDVGDYLEQIFPSLRIHFIAVNSSYDSDNYIGKTIGIDTSITNLINSLYSKDMSRKIKSAKVAKWKNGVYTAGKMPFGYIRDSSGPKKWLIDEDAAKIVSEIFEKAANGSTTRDIVEYLNANQIPTPGKYILTVYGEKLSRKRTTMDELLWNTQMVWKTLKNYAYTGCVVQGKKSTIIVGSSNARMVNEKDRFYIEGAIPPIVSKELFKNAQNAINNYKGASAKHRRNHLLKGKVKCGNCKLNMGYNIATYETQIYCIHSASVGLASKCSKEYYSSSIIEGQVRYAIINQLKLLSDLGYQLESKENTNRSAIDKQKKEATTKIAKLKAEKVRQYELFASGIITKDEFLRIKEKINTESDSLSTILDAINKNCDETNQLLFESGRLENKSEKLLAGKQLTPEIVDLFVKKIFLYSKDKIEIVFTFTDLIENILKQLSKNDC